MATEIENLMRVIKTWDCENVEDLRGMIQEMDRRLSDAEGGMDDELYEEIRAFQDQTYTGLPTAEIPEDIDTGYPVWACDKKGRCLVGSGMDTIETLDQIRG